MKRIHIKIILLAALSVCLADCSDNGSDDTPVVPKDTVVVTKTDSFAVSKINITTDGGKAITGKESSDYVTCSVSVTSDTKDWNYSGTGKIRGRGNSTWLWYPKKPYRIKLDKKASILGLGEDKDWVLLANYRDPTNMMTTFVLNGISIGRRLQDPLSELVKIDPESIGVGLYQHDVPNKQLSESLDFVVSKAVNSVGVNINTASPSLLKYVSGITKTNIDKILKYRDTKGKIMSRALIKKLKLLSDKTYEQAIGFLRIVDGDNVLDVTGIHPESYDITLKLLKHLNMTTKDIGTSELTNKLDDIDINSLVKELQTDIYTLDDIVKSLKKPNRDPRDEMPKPILKSDVLHIEDLTIGMKLQGTVRNVVDFGAFIDIGLHNDALVHISKISDKYLRHPSDILSVGDVVDCYVIDINIPKEKVSLSLIEQR